LFCTCLWRDSTGNLDCPKRIKKGFCQLETWQKKHVDSYCGHQLTGREYLTALSWSLQWWFISVVASPNACKFQLFLA
jgi:hypothetical protein